METELYRVETGFWAEVDFHPESSALALTQSTPRRSKSASTNHKYEPIGKYKPVGKYELIGTDPASACQCMPTTRCWKRGLDAENRLTSKIRASGSEG